MEKRVANNFPGPPPPAPYYHNNNNYNPHHHQIHPPQTPYHHVAAVGYQQYPQNENRDHRFNQPPHFDNHYPQVQQQPPQNMIGDHSNSNPPFTPSSSSTSNGFSPSGGVNSRKRKSLSATGFSPDPGVEGSSIAKLYVASVTKITSEDEIRQVFEKYGNVIEIILPKDKMTGERAAYCFVKYKKVEEGYAAIAALTDQFTFPGETAPVKVRFADAERERMGFPTVQVPEKVYVRCLNKLTTKAEIHEVFGRYGVIEDIYIALDDMKISRGYGFVQFSRREMALAAINGLNGIFTMRGSDQPLIVRFADPKKPRLGEPRSAFNTPPAMQQFDPNWHPQPYSQWGNNEPAAPRVVQPHDFASQPNNHFPQQNAQAVSETAGVETRSALPEDENECDWSEHTCPDGNKYYFHCVTYESTWEKPEEYSMFEKWLEEQQDQKLVSTPINNQSQGSTENSEQVESHLLQETTKLQQPSLPTTDQENNLAHSVTRLAVETTCS